MLDHSDVAPMNQKYFISIFLFYFPRKRAALEHSIKTTSKNIHKLNYWRLYYWIIWESVFVMKFLSRYQSQTIFFVVENIKDRLNATKSSNKFMNFSCDRFCVRQNFCNLKRILFALILFWSDEVEIIKK